MTIIGGIHSSEASNHGILIMVTRVGATVTEVVNAPVGSTIPKMPLFFVVSRNHEATIVIFCILEY
jgi:hypothetical protein